MSSIALLGFADSESERLAAGITALDSSLKLVKFTADTSKDELASSVEGAVYGVLALG